MFVHQAGAALLLIILTLWVQSAGVAALVAWLRLRHAATGNLHQHGVFRAAGLVVRLAIAVIALQLLDVLLWASGYRWGCFPSWESALYFSASSYATVGYGEVVLPSQ